MADLAHEWTEEQLSDLEKRIRKEYLQAQQEVQAKLDDYLRRFRIKDEIKRDQVKRGVITEKEYIEWRKGQIIIGKRWQALRDKLALEYHNANQKAKEMSQSMQAGVYAENINYSTYLIEAQTNVDTSFTLYDTDTVKRILVDDPQMLPPPGKKVSANIAKGLDVRWNNTMIQSVMLQGILQGESIPQLAKRLETVTERNYKAAIRNARTMATGAQNAGRIDGFKRAEQMGIKLEQEWISTLDMRTRHAHRQLDHVKVKVGQPWKIDGYDIRFPGDPNAPGYLVYNCRCTVRGLVDGLEPQARKYRSDKAINGMDYEEWKKQKKSKSRPILSQAEKGEAIRRKYIREYQK